MVLADRYRRPADLPAVIPVFPLRGAILLPRANLPLNIFEPRYLEMIDDALGGERIIGMVQPTSSSGVVESPSGKAVEMRSVGCAGRITSMQELDDGRLVITLSGIARFDIIDELEIATPYRQVHADYSRFEMDFQAGVGEDEVDREKLLTALREYLDTNNYKVDWRAITAASSEFLINALAVMSPFGAEEKQALLEAETLKARAQVLVALAAMERASGGDSGGTLQ